MVRRLGKQRKFSNAGKTDNLLRGFRDAIRNVSCTAALLNILGVK